MKPRLEIVSPFFPPLRGGLADHTANLARHLAPDWDVSVLTTAGLETALSAKVSAAVSLWRRFANVYGAIVAPPREAQLLWQYVPHMYGRGGVNGTIPRVMARLRREGWRQWVLAHEIAGPYSPWPHRCFYAWFQRRQWRAILDAADRIGISTEAWLLHWRRSCAHRRQRLFLAPSPSNVPVVAVAANHRETWRTARGWARDTRVVVAFGAVAFGDRRPWIEEAVMAVRSRLGPTALVLMGHGDGQRVATSRLPECRVLHDLDPEEVSATFQACDVALFPFVDGVSERRTSFMAAIAHGCPVVTTLGVGTGPGLRKTDWFVGCPAKDRLAFCRAVVDLLASPHAAGQIGARGRSAYEKQFDWPVLRERLRTLREEPQDLPDASGSSATSDSA